MSYPFYLKVNHIQEREQYDAEIYSELPKGKFLVVIDNVVEPINNARLFKVQIMDHESADGGKVTAHTGWYKRQANEREVVGVLHDEKGNELVRHTYSYKHFEDQE